MIFVSTGGFSTLTAIDSISNLSKYNIKSFELSGGIYSYDLCKNLKKLSNKFNFVVHNYFPPPMEPFVLNLASLNDDIYFKSINHVKDSIKLASDLNSKYYSFHAGFLVDPKISELGRSVTKRKLFDKKESLKRFLYSLKILSEFSSKYNIELLIENNVLNKSNLERFGENPLLMVDIEDTSEIVSSLNNNIKLLIDVAHLKVSANTLKFNSVDYLKIFKKYIKAYHLSDNDGLSDSNSMISHDSWFWPHIQKNLDYYSIEVYNPNPKLLANQLELVNKIIGNKYQ